MAVVLGVSLGSSGASAQDRALDNKLVKYVEDAKKSGEEQSQVQREAITAGWPAAAVSEAVTHVYGTQNAVLAASAKPASSLSSEPQAQGEPPAGGPDAGQAPTNVALNNPAANAASGTTPKSSTGTKTDPKTDVKKDAKKGASGTIPQVPYEYRIGAGDVLQISVWKEPEASAQNVLVRPDGIISTPLIKEIQVAGLTPKQAETLITERLVKLIQEPDVTVVVSGMASKKIFAIGAVKKEGPIPYTYSMTIMQAISEAGGLTDYAKRNRIYVLRTENGKETRFPFQYDEILKGKHMEMNIVLLPFDTLVVPH